jgi:hypothetical protein
MRSKLLFVFILLHAGKYGFAQAPVITSFTPGFAAAGTPVTINGANFSTVGTDNVVFFGATKGQVTSASSTSLEVISPAGATYQPVSVTSGGLTGFGQKPFINTFGNGINSFMPGTFLKGTGFGTYGQMSAAIIEDLDGDGKPDIASISNSALAVSVLRNTTSGGILSMAPNQILFVNQYNVNDLAAADIDGDGKKDLVVVNSGSTNNTISVFKNSSSPGTISFEAPVLFSSLDYAYNISIGDLDNDGRPDVVVTNDNSGSVSILKNTSTGGTISFANAINFTVGVRMYDVMVTDLNGDNKADLVLLDGDFPANTLYLLANTTTGSNITFGAPEAFALPGRYVYSYTDNLFCGDLDGDNKPDIAVTNIYGDVISVFRNKTNGTNFSLANPVNLATESQASEVRFTDLDGDGKPEMFAISHNGGKVTVYKNNSVPGNLSMAEQVSYTLNDNFYGDGLAAGDLDGDGKPEIISGYYYSVSVLKNNIPDISIGSFSPASGGQGTEVLIKGKNLKKVVNVEFGGISASSFTRLSDTTISAIVGNGNSGNIVLTDTSNAKASLGTFQYTGPFVATITPAFGGAGTVVTMDGINLGTTTAVSFGGFPSASFNIVSPTRITAVVGLGGPGNIAVTNPNGLAIKSGFTFVPVPTITSFDPIAAGPASTITIKGKYFTGATAVTIGTAASNSFTIVSDTVITAVTKITGNGSVSVTSSYGTGSLAGFIFTPLPVITSFAPGFAAAGTNVVITGTNFSGTAANNIVRFGSVKAEVVSATATSITVKVPAGATLAPISVTVSGLTAYSANPFILSFGADILTAKSFTQQASTNVRGGRGTDLIAEDLDGDGKPDMISADDSLMIYRNISTPGNPAFANAEALTKVAHYYTKVNTGDIDGDGKPEIVFIQQTTSVTAALIILKNNSTPGNLSFTEISIPQAITLAMGVKLKDLDNDGKLDILIGIWQNVYGYGQVWVLRNTSASGAISFAPELSILTVQQSVSSVFMADDVDGDGKADIVTVTGSSGQLVINRNTSAPGNLSFSAPQSFSSGGYSQKVYMNDLDKDGKKDILLLNRDQGQIYILKNTSVPGNFSFTTNMHINNTTPVNLDFADVDGDGKVDLLGNNQYPANTVSVYKNFSTPGTLSFVKVDNTSEYNNEDIVACDIDGDGRPDISLINQALTVLRNNIHEPIINSFTPNNAAAGATVTINGNSFTGTTAVSFGGVPTSSFTVVSDNVITAISAVALAGNVSVKNAAGTGTLNDHHAIPKIRSFAPESGKAGTQVTIKGNNFNKVKEKNIVYFGPVKASITNATDTTLDVIVPKGSAGGRITVSTNTLKAYSIKPFTITFTGGDTSFSAVSFASPLILADVHPSEAILIEDMNNDGKPDIGVASFNNSEVFINNSDSAVYNFTLIPGDIGQNKHVLEDINGDGVKDKVGTNTNGTVGTNVSLRKGDLSSFSYKIPVTVYSPYPNYYRTFNSSPATDDINADGKPDIIMGNNNDNNVNEGSLMVVKNLSHDSIVSLQNELPISLPGHAGMVLTADLDGDGIPDILTQQLYNTSTQFSALRNFSYAQNIALDLPQYFAGNAATFTRYMAAADIDGDGKTDVVATNGINAFSFFRNNSVIGMIGFEPKVDFTTGNKPYGIAVGDINGDGKPDVIVANSQDNTISVFKNTSVPGNVSFAARVNYNTGGSYAAGVAISDMDMDGVPDLLVTNLYSGTVTILRNLQGDLKQNPLCNPIGNTTLNAGISGATYQWQLSTDSVNFVNINDNANYAGTHTTILALNNIPSEWYGNVYRCIAGTTIGPSQAIKFVNTWTGEIDNDWFKPGNWTCGTIPDDNTDVIIPPGKTIVLNSNTSIRSITLGAGATLTIVTGVVLTVAH